MNGAERPTQFSQRRLWDSWKPSDGGRPSGPRRSSGGYPRLVQAVAGLVDRGEDRVGEAVRLVARGQPDVAVGDGERERVAGGVDPPGVVVEREAGDEPAHDALLGCGIERAPQRRVVDGVGVRGDRGDDRDETGAELGEERPDLRGPGAGLVVVEERVVGVVDVVEALDVAVAELDVAGERGEEGRGVLAPAGLLPGAFAVGCCSGHLGAQLGGDPPGLRGVARTHADGRRVDRIGKFGVGEPVEEAGELIGGQQPMAHPDQRRELLGATRLAARRHLGALVPEEQRPRSPEVGDLALDLAQPLEIGSVRCAHRSVIAGSAEVPADVRKASGGATTFVSRQWKPHAHIWISCPSRTLPRSARSATAS